MFYRKFSPKANGILKYLTANNAIDKLCHPLNTKIYISPKGKLVIAPNRYKGTSYKNGTCFNNVEVIKLYSWLSCIFSFLRTPLYMDENIIRDARKILEQTNHCLTNCTNGHLKCRILKVENNIEKMIHILKQNEEIVNERFACLKIDLINALKIENGDIQTDECCSSEELDQFEYGRFESYESDLRNASIIE